jgi:FkbM family methyltransferase
MAANSLPRRVLKRVAAPLLNDKVYRVVQSLAMAWDIRSGSWREPELDLIGYAVREGETVLDIGANYGLYAFHLSNAVGENGRVYAFEPIPFTAGAFKIIARLLRFRNVELIEKGCAAENGTVDFTLPVQDNGAIIAGTVHIASRDNDRTGKEQHARFEKSRKITCDVVAIDDFFPSLDALSFIKCDIEGADLFAMRGAKKTLATHRPTVLIEINPWFLQGFGLEVADLVGFFTELGYELYRYENGRLHNRSARDVVEDNWVFVHPSRRDRLASIIAQQVS